jgi:RimJ/RimL family protein N-acetyltransferase
MAVEPAPQRVLPGAGVHLEPYRRCYAPLVAGWVRSALETYWLAPRTPPPLTAVKVQGWIRPGREPLVLLAVGSGEPVAYGELNVLNGGLGAFWLGHLIVAPEQRGRGVGRELTLHLLRRAFRLRGARRVTLVVFPENKQALACYESVGMRPDGYETHTFPLYRRRARLLRLAAEAPRRAVCVRY